jgi:hypothetical protein
MLRSCIFESIRLVSYNAPWPISPRYLTNSSRSAAVSHIRSTVSIGPSRPSKGLATVEPAEPCLPLVAPGSPLRNGLGGQRSGDRKLSRSMGGDGARFPPRHLPTFARLRKRVGRSGESSERPSEQVDYELFPLRSGRVPRPARRSGHCLWTPRRNPLLRLWDFALRESHSAV